MFKLLVAVFAVLGLAAAKPSGFAYSPVAYSSPLVYSAPAYNSPLTYSYSAPLAYSSPLTYSAQSPVAYSSYGAPVAYGSSYPSYYWKR